MRCRRPSPPALSRERARGPNRVRRQIGDWFPSPARGRGARGDGRVARGLARRIAPAKSGLFDYRGVSEIFAEHARSTAGRDLDYSALDYARLEADGPQQWPYKASTREPQRLYADGVFPTASGRARFLNVGYVPVAEPVSAHYPLRLSTGRLRDQWHTMSRSGLVPALTRHAEEPFVYLHPGDIQRYKIGDGALVRIKTRRGQIVLPAMGDDSLKPGHAWLPMHWGSGFIAGDGVNALANSARDPISHQPELKHSAAAIEVLEYEWQASAWVRGSIPVLRQRLARWLALFPYAVLMPTAIGGEGLRLRLASPRKVSAAVLAELARDLRLDEADLAFDDPARGILRRILRRDGQVAAYLLAGDTRAQDALLQWIDSGVAPPSIAQVLMGRAQAAARAQVICACENVSDLAINSAIDAGQQLEQLKATLKCGTACGSCVPQIKRMIQRRNTMELQA